MKNKRPHETHVLFRVLLLFALFSYLPNCDGASCAERFLTINTYDDLTTMYISCFGVDYDCTVHSSSPGAGCDDSSLTLVDTVPKGETKLVTYNLVYGAAICSNYQTSVQFDDNTLVVAQLPRASQSGKKFHTILNHQAITVSYKCGITALAAEANVAYSLDPGDADTNIVVASYQTHDITFDVNRGDDSTLKVTSDTSVIFSCRETSGTNAQLVVFEPISADPILFATPESSTYMFTLADCTTNALITDTSLVTVETTGWDRDDCLGGALVGETNEFGTFYPCVILLTPANSDTCITGIGRDNNDHIVAVGLPQSKLTSRLVSYPYQVEQYFFSFSLSVCSFEKSSVAGQFNLAWLTGSLENKAAIFSTSPTLLNEYDWIECTQPVFALLTGDNTVLFQSGLQPDTMWADFLVSEGCDQISIPTPTEPTAETPTLPPLGDSSPEDDTQPQSSKAMHITFSIGLVRFMIAFCCISVLRN